MAHEDLERLVRSEIELRTHQSTKIDGEDRVEHELRRVMSCISSVSKKISRDLKSLYRGYTGTQNTFGEEQIRLDVLTDIRLKNRLRDENSFHVRQLASEESDEVMVLAKDEGRYSVTFDPLDGSSVIDANLSVGTILGFYDGDLLDGKSGRESMAGAMYVVYGPATTLVYAIPGRGAHEFVLEDGNFILEKEYLEMKDKGQIYAPGGSENKWTSGHKAFIDDLKNQDYKLRYSGALVADVNHIIVKGGGLFSYPALTDAPNGKLRLLFELQPLALIVEEMGGKATNGLDDILDLVPKDLGQRSPVYIGSKKEVELARQYLTQ